MIKNGLKVLIITVLSLILFSACQKDDLLSDSSARLRFSEDTLLFDTVFVSLGSATLNLRLYNDYDQDVLISRIRLAGGPSSPYRINVNGTSGTDFNEVLLRSGDSLWIFAEVTIDPSNPATPFIVQDSILFELNGNQQDVDLVAWGQNAHFFVADQFLNITNAQGQIVSQIPYVLIDTNLNTSITWDASLPYVVYGGYAVVDSSQSLTITQGAQIHFQQQAGLWIYRGGRLEVQGTSADPVVFQGLRRETYLAEEPGQWDRIWINDGASHSIEHAIIKNGFIGLQTEAIFSPALAADLSIRNCNIRNMSGLGILARNYAISGYNNLITNCGSYAMALSQGGDYSFTHCTFANYWVSGQRSTPAIYLNNYVTDDAGNAFGLDLVKADFSGCIITGNNDNELELDLISTAAGNHLFQYCLITADNTTPTTDPLHFLTVYRNNDPGFENVNDADYHLNTNSFCVDKSQSQFVNGISNDLDGNQRLQGPEPDLGAYEER